VDVGLQKVLKAVSRSFYLTLRFLPSNFRKPTSLAYLVARASDTIADYRSAEVTERLQWLTNLRQRVVGDTSEVPVSPEWLKEHPHQGEQTLIVELPRVFQWIEHQPEQQQKHISEVLVVIIDGQISDLEYFEQNAPSDGAVKPFESEQQLDTYTYAVAGCVGEFWTKVGLATQPAYSRLDKDTLLNVGIQYGKGLQLINILRDVQSDEAIGRCYLPVNGESRSLWETRKGLLEKAEAYLQAGVRYSKSLSDWRTRWATLLPAKLGIETLVLLKQQTPENWKQPVKISRSKVYQVMWQSLWNLR